MDVTTEINKKVMSMGGSGSARLEYLSPNRNLHYANGSNSINTAPGQRITAIPNKAKLDGSVGLMGAENVFYKLDINITSSTQVFLNVNILENGYLPVWTTAEKDTVNDFETAVMDFERDFLVENDYEPAFISSTLSSYRRPILSVTLNNLKTGNMYVDKWVDGRIYSSKKEMSEYDTVYVDVNSTLYIGIHARNTRRLPYNFEVVFGDEFLEYSDLTVEQRRQLL